VSAQAACPEGTVFSGLVLVAGVANIQPIINREILLATCPEKMVSKGVIPLPTQPEAL